MLVDPRQGDLRFQSLQEAGWICGSWVACYCPVHPSLLWSLHPDALKRHRSGGRNAYSQGVKTIEVLWDLANPMFFDAIFKFVLFWVGDFCWCWGWMFQHQRATEKISEWLGDFFKMITYTLPLSSKPYVLDHTLQQDLLTTQYHFEHAEQLFLQLPISWNLFCFKSKKNNQPPPPNNNNNNNNRLQQKYLFLVASFGSKVISNKDRCWPSVALIPFWVSVVQLYAFALPWYHTGPPNWLKVGRGGGREGDEWHIEVFALKTNSFDQVGVTLNISRSHLILFLAECLTKGNGYWILVWSRCWYIFKDILTFVMILFKTQDPSHSSVNHKSSQTFRFLSLKKKEHTSKNPAPPTKFSKSTSTPFREKNSWKLPGYALLNFALSSGLGLGAALGVALGFGLGIGTAGLMAGILAVAAAAPAAGRDAQGTAAETGRGGDVLKMLKENL